MFPHICGFNQANASCPSQHTQREGEPTDRVVECFAGIVIIVAVAVIVLSITAFVYQICVLNGLAAGPMLPITLTAGCLVAAISFTLLCVDKDTNKLDALIVLAAAITTIALAACCYRGVFSAKIFAKAALITAGPVWGLFGLRKCCC